MIGETLYLYDGNYRVYEDDNGNKTSSPNPRHYFRPVPIIDETRNSWIVNHYGDFVKVNKETMAVRTLGVAYHRRAYTQQQMEEHIWMENNKYALVDMVKYCNDVTKLRMIKDILESVDE